MNDHLTFRISITHTYCKRGDFVTKSSAFKKKHGLIGASEEQLRFKIEALGKVK